MTLAEAAILGVVQGLTEFLPISSSGHLCLAQHVLKIGDSPSIVVFDIALHVASLLAILLMFAPRIRDVLLREHQMIVHIIVATIPAGIVGVALGEHLKSLFTMPRVVAAALLVTGGFLILADFLSKNPNEKTGGPTLKSSALMGLFQAIAIIPGISRSGLTITGGLMAGMTREKAFEFSFLMAIPAISGAAILEARNLNFSEWSIGNGPLLVGLGLSFVFSLIGLITLKRLVISRNLKWIGVYCLCVGIGALILL
ncbi:MAG: undecaprenyl-diphosphate phosphatase [Planctomycetota bacterium]|nr:undecaprenyl-diphosphate phosphatase [Planctomycetota bacterium]MDA1140010.1 undecaprenyl-diphosphate phosphatase [Planctomycetota bacterium]